MAQGGHRGSPEASELGRAQELEGLELQVFECPQFILRSFENWLVKSVWSQKPHCQLLAVQNGIAAVSTQGLLPGVDEACMVRPRSGDWPGHPSS